MAKSNPVTPIPPATPVPVENKKVVKQELLEKMNKCLKEYGGESNVPITHDYWDWLKEYRSL